MQQFFVAALEFIIPECSFFVLYIMTMVQDFRPYLRMVLNIDTLLKDLIHCTSLFSNTPCNFTYVHNLFMELTTYINVYKCTTSNFELLKRKYNLTKSTNYASNCIAKICVKFAQICINIDKIPSRNEHLVWCLVNFTSMNFATRNVRFKNLQGGHVQMRIFIK